MEELHPEDIEQLLQELKEDETEAERMADEASPSSSDKAAQHLERALALEKEDWFVWALDECDTALRLDPSLADAHNLRGVILEELGREREAVLAYREALRLDPSFDAARENLQAVEVEPRAAKAGATASKGDKVTSRPVTRIEWANEQVAFEAEGEKSYYSWRLARVELEPVAGAITIHGYPDEGPTIAPPVSKIARFEIVEREDIPRNLQRMPSSRGGCNPLGLFLDPTLFEFLAFIEQERGRGLKVQALKLTQSRARSSAQGWVIHLFSEERAPRGQDATFEMARRIATFLRHAGYNGTIPEELSPPKALEA